MRKLFFFVFLTICLLCDFSAESSEGDFSVVQRGGTSFNKGTLSRDSRYPTYTLGFSHSFYTNVGKLGLEFSNLVSVSHSAFYTLKTPDLKFPLIAKAPYQLIEPSFMYNMCLFVYTKIRPCIAGGVSAAYLRHDSDNYAMYSAFPAQARLQVVMPTGIFLEGGATYRRISSRTTGDVAWSSDLTVFFGLGLLFMSQF